MADMKLNELEHEQRQEYQNLLQENKDLMNQINYQRQDLEQLNALMIQSENRLRMEGQKLKAQQLKDQIQEMQEKKADLELQLNEANLSFPEARDKLLARIKDDNAFITNTDKRIKEIRRNIDNYEKKIKELQQEQEDKKSQDQDKQKYEILYQRDQEMTEYINKFESNRNNELESMQQLENQILDILDQSSKLANVMKTLPNQEEFKEISSEMNFKTVQTQNSETTLKKLQIEYEPRLTDLKKIEQAEERVISEISTLTTKKQDMDNEINLKFNKVSEIKVKEEQRKQRMIKERSELQAKKESYEAEVVNSLKVNYIS